MWRDRLITSYVYNTCHSQLAYRLFEVVENVERVIAIELLAACQAIEFLRPLKTTVPLEEVYNVVRSVVRWGIWKQKG